MLVGKLNQLFIETKKNRGLLIGALQVESVGEVHAVLVLRK